MSRIIAAIDNSAAATPVLAAAFVLADLFHSRVDAIHVREDGARTAKATAQAVGVALREVSDPAAEALVREGKAPDVAALVLGARGYPGGRHPAGHVALDVITSLAKPLLVVPPQSRLPVELRCALVPLDGTLVTAAALEETVELARGSEVEIVVLHVHDEETLPPFSDQPQHETDAWAAEFLARYCPRGGGLELRVGVPAEHVLEVAEEVGADLIVLGWARDLAPGRAEVVRRVLARSHVPVLLVPCP